MRSALTALSIALLLTAPPTSHACDWNTGAREQQVFLSWNGKAVGNWVAEPGAIKKIALPNSFVLGVQLDEPEGETYRDLATKASHVPEMVKISLFDLGGSEPKLLTHTYGGTNSLQGYGAAGGADRVESLGSPGVLLTLIKPVCAPKSAVALSR